MPIEKFSRTFDPAERIRQKQLAREKDEADLKAGRVTKEELQKRNAFIPADWARNAKLKIRNPMRCDDEDDTN